MKLEIVLLPDALLTLLFGVQIRFDPPSLLLECGDYREMGGKIKSLLK